MQGIEYSKNLLLKTDRSYKLIIFGIAMALFALAWPIKQLTTNGSIHWLDWIFFTVFAINGGLNCLRGFGYPMAYIFGSAYVKANAAFISVKASSFEPENKILWADIKSIEYKATRFRVTKIDQSEQRLCMRKLDDDTVNEMRIKVEEIAKQKTIPYSTVI